MGCAMLSSDQNARNDEHNEIRKDKKTTKLDCRKKSTKSLDAIIENINISNQKLSEQQQKFAKEVLQKHDLFCTLEQDQSTEVRKHMATCTTPNGQYIFKEGDQGVCFFIIQNGEVDLEIGGKYRKTLRRGDSFGELALIYLSKRSGSIKSRSPKLRLLFIKSKVFKATLSKINGRNIQIINKVFEKVQIFFCLSTKQKYALVNCFKRVKFPMGKCIFKKGDESNNFYIVQTGEINLRFENSTKRDLTLGELQSFGESALKKEGLREGTATAQLDSVCLYIDKQSMEKSLGDKVNNIIFQNIKKWALKNSSEFYNLSNSQVQKIASEFKTKLAKTNDILMDEGKPIRSVIICLEGKINGKGPGTVFCDEYINREQTILKNWILKNDNGVYAELSFDRIKQILEVLTEGRQGKRNTGKFRKQARKSTFKENQPPYLNIKNFDFLTKLGQGQFGQVYLIKDRKLGTLFALKCISKSGIVSQGMEDCVISERKILTIVNHPFIVGYYKAFQDKSYIYLLLQYINGIEMYYAIRQIGILTKTISRFYFSSVLIALQYLHSLNIIYRDIKPENCMIDSEGKVFLIDLGTAKMLNKEQGFRTETIIGTPHYLAPQVMQGKGYSFQVDFWSLGVLFYELVSGKLPFAETLDNPYDIYGEIMRNKVIFPKFMKDEQEKMIINQLLEKNPSNRIQNGGFKKIKESKYFDGFKWKDLQEGKMYGPYVPKRYKSSAAKKYEEIKGYPLIDHLKEISKSRQTPKIEDWISNTIE